MFKILFLPGRGRFVVKPKESSLAIQQTPSDPPLLMYFQFQQPALQIY